MSRDAAQSGAASPTSPTTEHRLLSRSAVADLGPGLVVHRLHVCHTDHYYPSGFGLPRTGFLTDQATMPPRNIGRGPFSGDNTRFITWS
ncbi:hypothetical protein [Micromonospora carbonacea]|uniref:hypothetical protein n=1 Tax=Micromonospora carbonacea TaxID=47853 RepID=UPI00114CF9CC|nr:hypothetical protein [Micromonospora carbonacea]